MAQALGRVTRVIAGTRPWLARREDGALIDMFASLREGQVAVEKRFGRLLTWRRDPVLASGGVESWSAQDPKAG